MFKLNKNVFYNKWNKRIEWKWRRENIQKEAHMKNHLRIGGYNIQGEERSRKVCNSRSYSLQELEITPSSTNGGRDPAEKNTL